METVLLALVSWKLRNFRKFLTRESIINVAGFLRYASETTYYKKLKNTQLSDNVNNNEKLVEQFFEVPFFRGAILQGETFRGEGNFPETIFCCGGGNFSGGFFPRCILPNTVVMYHYLERLIHLIFQIFHWINQLRIVKRDLRKSQVWLKLLYFDQFCSRKHLLNKLNNHFIILFNLQKFEKDMRLGNLYRFPFIIF